MDLQTFLLHLFPYVAWSALIAACWVSRLFPSLVSIFEYGKLQQQQQQQQEKQSQQPQQHQSQPDSDPDPKPTSLFNSIFLHPIWYHSHEFGFGLYYKLGFIILISLLTEVIINVYGRFNPLPSMLSSILPYLPLYKLVSQFHMANVGDIPYVQLLTSSSSPLINTAATKTALDSVSSHLSIDHVAAANHFAKPLTTILNPTAFTALVSSFLFTQHKLSALFSFNNHSDGHNQRDGIHANDEQSEHVYGHHNHDWSLLSATTATAVQHKIQLSTQILTSFVVSDGYNWDIDAGQGDSIQATDGREAECDHNTRSRSQFLPVLPIDLQTTAFTWQILHPNSNKPLQLNPSTTSLILPNLDPMWTNYLLYGTFLSMSRFVLSVTLAFVLIFAQITRRLYETYFTHTSTVAPQPTSPIPSPNTQPNNSVKTSQSSSTQHLAVTLAGLVYYLLVIITPLLLSWIALYTLPNVVPYYFQGLDDLGTLHHHLDFRTYTFPTYTLLQIFTEASYWALFSIGFYFTKTFCQPLGFNVSGLFPQYDPAVLFLFHPEPLHGSPQLTNTNNFVNIFTTSPRDTNIVGYMDSLQVWWNDTSGHNTGSPWITWLFSFPTLSPIGFYCLCSGAILVSCLTGFIFFSLMQHRCHAILANLRKPFSIPHLQSHPHTTNDSLPATTETTVIIDGKYKLPIQGWFRTLACPHYLCEIMVYTIIAAMVPYHTSLPHFVWYANRQTTALTALTALTAQLLPTLDHFPPLLSTILPLTHILTTLSVLLFPPFVLCALWVVSNLYLMAQSTHQWYNTKFTYHYTALHKSPIIPLNPFHFAMLCINPFNW